MSATEQFIDFHLLDLIKGRDIRSVIDIGAGKGGLLKRFSKNLPSDCKYVGVDYYSHWPENERPKSGGDYLFIDKNSADYKEILNKRTFDLAVSTFSLHHFKFPFQELTTIENLLNQNGLFFMLDLHFSNETASEKLKNILSFMSEYWALMKNDFHRHHYLLEEALDLVRAAGFNVVESRVERISSCSEEINEDTQNSIKQMRHLQNKIAGFNDKLVETYLSLNTGFIIEELEKSKIDYSSMFFIKSKKI